MSEAGEGLVTEAEDGLVGEDELEADSENTEVLVLEEAPDPDSQLLMWEPTGHATVDAALEQMHALADADVSEHAATFERIEQSLRATLDGLAAEGEPA